MRRRRGVRVLAAVAVAGALAAPGGWVLTDRLEQDNDFCNACHLGSGVPLHIDLRKDFDARSPASLSAAHAAAGNDARADGAFRCIDCHGGASWPGRLRVKTLAARDAFWWAVGSFEEPREMRWPLWDEDCLQCHEFDGGDVESWEAQGFHQLPVHNADLGVGCVECHLSHEAGVDAEAHFLDVAAVRLQCARCHPEFEEGGT